MAVDDVIDASDDNEEDEVASDIQELENQELLEEQRLDEVRVPVDGLMKVPSIKKKIVVLKLYAPYHF